MTSNGDIRARKNWSRIVSAPVAIPGPIVHHLRIVRCCCSARVAIVTERPNMKPRQKEKLCEKPAKNKRNADSCRAVPVAKSPHCFSYRSTHRKPGRTKYEPENPGVLLLSAPLSPSAVSSERKGKKPRQKNEDPVHTFRRQWTPRRPSESSGAAEAFSVMTKSRRGRSQ